MTVPESEPFSFTWEALDPDSGIADVKAVFDRGTYQQGTTIDLTGKPGKHQLEITAIDMVGNTTKKSFMIEVTTSANEMIKLVTRLEEAGEFSNHGNARALQAHLETVKKFQEKGETKGIDTVVIDWEAARAKTFKILVGSDKEQWTNVIDNDGIIEGIDGKQTIRFNPTTARYVKFQGIQRATVYGYSFYEFEVHKRF
ncbi:hypothetical protein BVG16_05865 [Paenibacillus selenitireducens]|uniref:F5/8 type C domain-containing protein n=1 Tax=Paenibacillus selenitireducens TaxID=1324314 RepID=A0A1T2XKC0_9BACL|nr:discoidin domain-containing protein [Paenibacillus selenitireducens]OPA80262.1 hypothetical protein BVG16_05865 [Paenibacillus selenitireducens]